MASNYLCLIIGYVKWWVYDVDTYYIQRGKEGNSYTRQRKNFYVCENELFIAIRVRAITNVVSYKIKQFSLIEMLAQYEPNTIWFPSMGISVKGMANNVSV